MYSQNDEERHILAHFDGRMGRLLDIGAYDGRTFSNTCRLIELGWSAVLVEPSPSVFPRLADLHGANAQVTLVQAAVGEHNGFERFFDSGGDAVSTLDPTHKQKWEQWAQVSFNEVQVPAVTVDDLFAAHGFDFDFINLDVEGTNWRIFRQMRFDLMPMLKLVCVEHDGWIAGMLDQLRPLGFARIACNAENLIAGR